MTLLQVRRYLSMRSDGDSSTIAVFDLGGTWFRWGRYSPARGLLHSEREPAINYLLNPDLSSTELQRALADFILTRTRQMQVPGRSELRAASVSVGAPVNANSRTVLGSGPLWGPTAGPFPLEEILSREMPGLQWHVVNDVTALLAPYTEGPTSHRKTLLITVSSGVAGRLYDHQSGRIPYDGIFGVQGEIGHLTLTFELGGQVVNRRCECGGWNHLNAFSSGRGIAQTLKTLPSLTAPFGTLFADPPECWCQVDDTYRLNAFKGKLEEGNDLATSLLDAMVTPLSRILATALSLDPEIDRIVMTGGVVHGLDKHYRDALQRTFVRDGLYQISERDPYYLARRLVWEGPDDFNGLRGAGLYVDSPVRLPNRERN